MIVIDRTRRPRATSGLHKDQRVADPTRTIWPDLWTSRQKSFGAETLTHSRNLKGVELEE